MANRDYVRCLQCETRICYDGDDAVRDAIEARWGNLESPVWTEGLGLLCPDCTTKLQSRLAALEAWGKEVRRRVPGLVATCCLAEMDAILRRMPEVE